MPGFTGKGFVPNAFRDALWPQLSEPGDEEINILEARCYEAGEVTAKPLQTYSGTLSRKLDRERPQAVIANDMGGLMLVAAMMELARSRRNWQGKIVFVNVPFRGAPEWMLSLGGFPTRAPPLRELLANHRTMRELLNSFPVQTPALIDMLDSSEFIRRLDYASLAECEILCLSGKFTDAYFGIAGLFAKPIMEPKDLFSAQVRRFRCGRAQIVRDPHIGRTVRKFVVGN